MSLLRAAATAVIDLFYPKFCVQCHRLGAFLCSSCANQLEFFPPFPLVIDRTRIPSLNAVWAGVRYQPPITAILYQLKYNGTKALGSWCGQLLYDHVAWPDVDLVTSIPLHPHKYATRGYNQAAEVAQALARAAQLPYLETLVRVRDTLSQAKQQNIAGRLQNANELFVQQEVVLTTKALKDKHVLLVDDVVTTGSTLESAAQVLRAAGAQTVTGLAVAHRG